MPTLRCRSHREELFDCHALIDLMLEHMHIPRSVRQVVRYRHLQGSQYVDSTAVTLLALEMDHGS